ncbi:hypothetical protein ACSQ67_024741 [Phaseolus vulgaris]
MAATTTASSMGPRYAPPHPTLPKPWKGLVDGKTGTYVFRSNGRRLQIPLLTVQHLLLFLYVVPKIVGRQPFPAIS